MVLRSRCTAALLLPGRAAAKYAIPQPAPIAQLDRASDYESEGRVFESPWAHSRRSVVRQSLQPSQELADLRASSLSPRLGGAHEALRRNAFDLAAVACLPAVGFGGAGSACHE